MLILSIANSLYSDKPKREQVHFIAYIFLFVQVASEHQSLHIL